MFQSLRKKSTHISRPVPFFPKSCLLWDNVKNTVEQDRPQMRIRRMRFEYWINGAADTHSEYVIRYFFFTVTKVRWTRLIVTYICRLPFTQRQGRPVSYHTSYLEIFWIKSVRKAAIMLDNYRGSYQSLQNSSGILPANKPRLLLSKFYATNCSNLSLETGYPRESFCGFSQWRQQNNEILIVIRLR